MRLDFAAEETMSAEARPEPCPRCGTTESLRPKLVLIDEAWVPAPGKDSRMAYHVDLRADDVKPESRKEPPLEQFVEAWYCDRCGRAFVAEQDLREARRHYHRHW
jgi:hypothetical protein